MASNHILIPLLTILACIILINKSVGTQELRREYAQKRKATIKTIKRQDGDIVDCVDIYKQPSLEHPLLKNHTVQLPKYNVSSQHLSNFNIAENERCPKGTVPIRRAFKNESPSHPNEATPIVYHKYAMYGVRDGDGDITALSALISVWRPYTLNSDFSTAEIQAGSVTDSAHEFIKAGWMVNPSKYGDKEPRFFIYFANKEHPQGCYDNEYPGFVTVDSDACIGCKILPISTYDGNLYEISLALRQDPSSREWWLNYHDTPIGYWPSEVLPELSRMGSVNIARWGGDVSQEPDSPNPTLTHMGNGHFPKDALDKAAYFQDVTYVCNDADPIKPTSGVLEAHLSHPSCYELSDVFGDGEGNRVNSHFYFGGPGADSPYCDV